MNKREEVEEGLARLRHSLGGAAVKLKDISDGVVTVKYYRPLINPSACHVDGAKVSEDIIIEALEHVIKEIIPDLREVVLLQEG